MKKTPALSRRRFLTRAVSALGVAASVPIFVRERRAVAEPTDDGFSFLFVGDTHYFADKADPAKMDEASVEVTTALIDTLNRLPGTDWPEAAGGGKVLAPKGVIHAGDCIDTADKGGPIHARMQDTEWGAFRADWGLAGGDGRLKFPVYEVHGNHDGPRGEGPVVKGIIERNKKRPGLVNVSAGGLHYSWDWNGVHFVNLGIVVGSVPEITRRRRYDPMDSFKFLVDDLAAKVGDSGRPVVITHHVDVARYTGECDHKSEQPQTKEWDPCDVHAYHKAISKYNVLAVMYGHTHARNVFKWDGRSTKAAEGIGVFNVDNSSHYKDNVQGVFYCRVVGGKMTVAEYKTADRWKTAAWTPQVWTSAVKAKAT